MKTLNNYITEKLKITKDTKIKTYKYFPKNKFELREILEDRLKKDKNADLNDIDVSKITDIGYVNPLLGIGFRPLFEDLDPHNIDISEWDVSNVEYMNCVFSNCENLNCDFSNWDVSKVESMDSMFFECTNFKGNGLEYWKPTKCKNFQVMFKKCTNLNCDLSNWNVSNVNNMRYMFDGCTTLEKNNLIPSWYN